MVAGKKPGRKGAEASQIGVKVALLLLLLVLLPSSGCDIRGKFAQMHLPAARGAAVEL